MPDQSFEKEVLSHLIELKTVQAETTVEVKNIVARLDKLNGTVARHEEKIGAQTVDLLQHVNACPMRDRLSEVESFISAQKATTDNDKDWKSKLHPALWMAISAVIVLVMLHSADMLKFWRP